MMTNEIMFPRLAHSLTERILHDYGYTLAIVVFTLMLVGRGGYLLRRVRVREPFLVYLTLALLPMLIGLWGTSFGVIVMLQPDSGIHGCQDIEGFVQELGDMLLRTYMGVVGSIPLVIMAVVGIWRTRKRSQPSDGANAAHGAPRSSS